MPLVWDPIELDVFIKVAELTFLSVSPMYLHFTANANGYCKPFFAVWVPVLLLSQGVRTTDTAFKIACSYVLGITAFALARYLNRVWKNRLWGRGLRGMLNNHRLDWENQIVVVTGGATGLGRLIIETLAVRHVTVVCLALQEAEFDYDDVHSYACDVSDRDAVFKTAARVVEEVGHPTILINNAGLVQPGAILDLTEESIRRTLDVMVLGHYWTVQAFLPEMIKRNSGHIVTIASILSSLGVARLSDYCAAKAGVRAFHESLRVELRQVYNASNVRTTLVCPGHILTALFEFFAPHTSVQRHGRKSRHQSALDCVCVLDIPCWSKLADRFTEMGERISLGLMTSDVQVELNGLKLGGVDVAASRAKDIARPKSI